MRTKHSILTFTKYSFLLSCFFIGCNKKDLKEDESPRGIRVVELIDEFGGTVEKQTFKYSGDQFSGVADSTWPLQDPANKQFYYNTTIELMLGKNRPGLHITLYSTVLTRLLLLPGLLTIHWW